MVQFFNTDYQETTRDRPHLLYIVGVFLALYKLPRWKYSYAAILGAKCRWAGENCIYCKSALLFESSWRLACGVSDAKSAAGRSEVDGVWSYSSQDFDAIQCWFFTQARERVSLCDGVSRKWSNLLLQACIPILRWSCCTPFSLPWPTLQQASLSLSLLGRLRSKTLSTTSQVSCYSPLPGLHCFLSATVSVSLFAQLNGPPCDSWALLLYWTSIITFPGTCGVAKLIVNAFNNFRPLITTI